MAAQVVSAEQAVLVVNARLRDKSNDDKGGKDGGNDDNNDGAQDDNRHNYGAHNDDAGVEVKVDGAEPEQLQKFLS